MLMFKLKKGWQVGSGSKGACGSLRTWAPLLELTWSERRQPTPQLASGFHTCAAAHTELWLTSMHSSLHTCAVAHTEPWLTCMHAHTHPLLCSGMFKEAFFIWLSLCHPHMAGRSGTVYVVFTPKKVAHLVMTKYVSTVSYWACCKCLCHCKEQTCSSPPYSSFSGTLDKLIKIGLKDGHGGICLLSQHAGGWDRKIVSVKLA